MSIIRIQGRTLDKSRSFERYEHTFVTHTSNWGRGGAGVAKIMRGAHLAFRFDFIVISEWRIWPTRQLVLYLGLLYRY